MSTKNTSPRRPKSTIRTVEKACVSFRPAEHFWRTGQSVYLHSLTNFGLLHSANRTIQPNGHQFRTNSHFQPNAHFRPTDTFGHTPFFGQTPIFGQTPTFGQHLRNHCCQPLMVLVELCNSGSAAGIELLLDSRVAVPKI